MKVSIKGKPVAVLASGPSLTLADIELVRQAGICMIAVNNTYEIVPDAHVIFAGDTRWWKAHGDSITSSAMKVSRSNKVKQYGAKCAKTRIRSGYNSGMSAIEWALMKGAKKVILLGFDCSLKHGIHHHGPHEKTPNPNQHRLKAWQKQFTTLRKHYKKADIVNCSRYTELEVFPRQPLECVLCQLG